MTTLRPLTSPLHSSLRFDFDLCEGVRHPVRPLWWSILCAPLSITVLFVALALTPVSAQYCCFNGACQVVQLQDQVNTHLYNATRSPVSILGTAPLATAMIAIRKPCLLTSTICQGRAYLGHCLPCCCEQRLGPAATLPLLASLEGKFQGNKTALLKWNGIEKIMTGQRLQLCFDDELIAKRRKQQEEQQQKLKKLKQQQLQKMQAQKAAQNAKPKHPPPKKPKGKRKY